MITILFVLVDVIGPIGLVLLFLYKNKETRDLRGPRLLYAGLIAFILFPLLLPRKHFEGWLIQQNSDFYFVAFVVQMHNNLYEELAKLISLILAVLLLKERGQKVLSSFRGALYLGYALGLFYGVGEAVTLTLIAKNPPLYRIFGVNLFLLFINYRWLWERFLALQMHGIMGGLVGIGYHYLRKKNLWRFLLFFLIAILYHELVDGLIIYIGYNAGRPLARFLLNHLFTVVLPAEVAIGYIILAIFARKGGRNVEFIADCPPRN
ncbi:MAG TPA: hypothetical protein ENG67_05150 [candidate division WOR-3 bacterium]|uniref:PrsW family intramembrane metalloprotease n=1 Tax=candidate division WOR-3 bacterium TaxID=2052148 RepID=A0A7C0X9S9_UNCW3|nr:hypothetical protein [candidate division WOR-3 bacterium]